VSYCGALITPDAWKYIDWLLAKRKVLLAADEASWMCNWNARTRRMLALGGFYKRPTKDLPKLPQGRGNVVVKAVLDGTPLDEAPDDVYYPLQFLQRGMLGFDSPSAFRARYHAYETETVVAEDGTHVERVRMMKNHSQMRFNPATSRWEAQEFPIFAGYRNLDELSAKLATIGSRVLRAEVSDAPSPTFDLVRFDLTPRQREVYEDARDRYTAEMRQGTWSLQEVLKRVTRLQQIARNYFPPEKIGMPCRACRGASTVGGDECEACEGLGVTITSSTMERIDARNPAAEALVARLKESTGPTIVWSRFRQDVSDTIEAAADIGLRLLRYDGSIPPAEREANYRAFRAGDADGMSGTVTSGLSRGKNLTRATDIVFFSNWFGRRPRSQAQDRCEALDRAFSTRITDLVANGTRDEAAVAVLKEKGDRAALLLGDVAKLLTKRNG
jgi:SNF2 family DNA or RNA helicase